MFNSSACPCSRLLPVSVNAFTCPAPVFILYLPVQCFCLYLLQPFSYLCISNNNCLPCFGLLYVSACSMILPAPFPVPFLSLPPVLSFWLSLFQSSSRLCLFNTSGSLFVSLLPGSACSMLLPVPDRVSAFPILLPFLVLLSFLALPVKASACICTVLSLLYLSVKCFCLPLFLSLPLVCIFSACLPVPQAPPYLCLPCSRPLFVSAVKCFCLPMFPSPSCPYCSMLLRSTAPGFFLSLPLNWFCLPLFHLLSVSVCSMLLPASVLVSFLPLLFHASACPCSSRLLVSVCLNPLPAQSSLLPVSASACLYSSLLNCHCLFKPSACTCSSLLPVSASSWLWQFPACLCQWYTACPFSVSFLSLPVQHLCVPFSSLLSVSVKWYCLLVPVSCSSWFPVLNFFSFYLVFPLKFN